MSFVLQPWHLLLTILRMAEESPFRGYVRLQGALANLGHKLSDTTVGNILREHGIKPVPERRRQATWKEFIEAHGDVLSTRADAGPRLYGRQDSSLTIPAHRVSR